MKQTYQSDISTYYARQGHPMIIRTGLSIITFLAFIAVKVM